MQNQNQNQNPIAPDAAFGIVCPYCFNLASGGNGAPFPHTAVHFRAETSFTNVREIEAKLGFTEIDIDLADTDTERKRKRMAYNLHKQFLSRDDEKYQEFWNKFEGRTTEQSERNGTLSPWKLPIISKGNGIQTLVADADGFVTHAVDAFNQETYRRVCPHCHNPLPMKYGKTPVKFISIIGITGSGKTVYISQLLKNMTNCVSKSGLSAYFTTDHETNFITNNKVAKGVPLPFSTAPGSLSQPMFYDIVRLVNGKQRTDTIVLYDIAGENCRNANDMVRFSSFVKHSDGLILLIDPKQLGFLPGANAGAIDPPGLVLNTLHTVLESQQGKKTSVPIAICVSKSDQCAGILPQLAQEQVQVAERDPHTGLATLKFDAKVFNKLAGELKELMLNNPDANTVCQNLMNEYWNYNFFAVSAIGCACEKTDQGFAPISRPNPMRIEEPILWLFKQFGIIGYNEHVKRPFPIRQATRYHYIKKLFKKPYLQATPEAFSEYEEDPVREYPEVLQDGVWRRMTDADRTLIK